MKDLLESIRDFVDAEDTDDPMGFTLFELILDTLAAMNAQYHFTHWKAAGDSYYGDHLLFQRLYETVSDEYDSVGERIVGTYGARALFNAQRHGAGIKQLLDDWSQVEDPYRRALAVERQFLTVLRNTIDALDETEQLTDGIEDLLQSIANTHETHIYLLKQRIR